MKKLLHNLLGWGFFDGWADTSDKWQPTAKCRFCEYELAQDSTGAWFHLSEKVAEPINQKE